jgi:hypothetical protein
MLASSMIDGEIVEHLQSLSTVWSLTAAGFTNFLALFSWGSAYAPPQALCCRPLRGLYAAGCSEGWVSHQQILGLERMNTQTSTGFVSAFDAGDLSPGWLQKPRSGAEIDLKTTQL